MLKLNELLPLGRRLSPGASCLGGGCREKGGRRRALQAGRQALFAPAPRRRHSVSPLSLRSQSLSCY